jgi:hypothetical protein
MSYEVRDYELPESASSLDKATLAIWKSWLDPIKPFIGASVAMGVVSIIVGTFLAKSGGYVAVWSPANYAPAVATGESSFAGTVGDLWNRGIVAQLVSAAAATLVAWPVLRRAHNPARIGGVAGLAVVAAHLTFSHQWGMNPIVGAPVSYQIAAVASLWLLPITTASLGALLAYRRALGRVES